MNWLWLMTDSLVKYQFYWEQRERVKYYEPKFREKVFSGRWCWEDIKHWLSIIQIAESVYVLKKTEVNIYHKKELKSAHLWLEGELGENWMTLSVIVGFQ